MNFAASNPMVGFALRDTLAGLQGAQARQLADLSRATIEGFGAKEEGRLMAKGAAPTRSFSGADLGSLFSGLGSVVRGFTPARGSSSNLFPYGDYTSAFRGL